MFAYSKGLRAENTSMKKDVESLKKVQTEQVRLLNRSALATATVREIAWRFCSPERDTHFLFGDPSCNVLLSWIQQ